jgi:hypothetical protein
MKLSIPITCALALSVSCGIQSSFEMHSSGLSGVKGSGVVIEETRDVAAFDSIRVEGSLDVVLSLGEAGPVRIKAEDNLAPLVIATVKGSELTLKTSDSYNTKVGIEVYVTAEDIRAIKASGSTDVLCQGLFEVEELDLEASGSSDIECAVKAGSLTVTASGASDIRLSGDVNLLNVVASGSSDVAAFELVAAEADVKTSGASDASVNAKFLQAHASGSSDIRYRGLPEKLTSKDRGAGSIGPEGT